MENPWKRFSKVNPQRENGHRQIANDVFRALRRSKMNGVEWAVVFTVIDLTYGFNRLYDGISLTQLAKATGWTRRAIIYALSELENRRILVIERRRVVNELSPGVVNNDALNNLPNLILFNKHYDTWISHENRVVNKRSPGSEQIDAMVVNKRAPTKETLTKETTTAGEKKKKGKVKLEYPDWLNLTLWGEFKKHRVKLKLPMSEYSEKLAIGKLRKCMDGGEKQEDVVNRSIESGWRTFFPRKEEPGIGPKDPGDWFCKKCGKEANSLSDGKCMECQG